MWSGAKTLNSLHLTIVGLFGVGVCGCDLAQWAENDFKLGPEYTRPEADVAERWLDNDDARVSTLPPDHPDWWSVLNDPILNRLVETAAAENLSLREAGYRVLQTRAQRDIAIGNLFPQQQIGSGGFSWNQVSENSGAPEPEATARMRIADGLSVVQDPPGYVFQQWVGAPGIDSTFSNWQFGASASWELDVWGRFRLAIDSADARLEASVQDYRAILVSLIAEVATTYIEIRTAQLRLEYARRNVDTQQASLELSEIKAREGKTGDISVQLAKSNLKATEAVIPGLKTNLRQANNRLCTLLGRPIESLLDRIEEAKMPMPPPEIALGIPADLLRRRPDVREAERNLAAQSAQIGIAETELYPQFALSGNIFVEAEQFEKLWRGDSFGYSAGPSFTWNILNYGRLINNVRFQEAAFQELVAAYKGTVLNANQEVEDALVSFLQTQEQVQLLRESAEALKKSLDLALVLFKEGAIDFTAVFVLQGDLTRADDQLAATQGNAVLSLINVYKALGGGWEVFSPPEGIAASNEGKADNMPTRTTTQPASSTQPQPEAAGQE